MSTKPTNENPIRNIKRLLTYMTGKYRFQFSVIVLSIVISAIVGIIGTVFLKTLIDSYIAPFIGQANPDMSGLLITLAKMGALYLIGVIAIYVSSRLMINVCQGTLKNLRDDMFTHMQKLPIRYFDTHSHGELMSRYTNDIDTLRQMISQGIPQIISSGITILGVIIAMIVINIPLTFSVLAIGIVMVFCVKYIGKRSSFFFKKQQVDMGKVNGYVEEMMEGQKVVKVFTHEQQAILQFDQLNERLFESSRDAHIYANILMPVLGNLGYVNYALTAIAGAVLAINGIGGLTIGGLASFLQLSRSFSIPISQISQQFNSIVMALAGAGRIFEIFDEEVETDDGYVTLVNAYFNKENLLTETSKRTGIWAWKHPHADGSITYTQVKGDVRFMDVDFGYTDKKLVLRKVSLFAKPGQKIAFVGSTGAGKTTITNLINRFYDLQDGKIRYDGININKIKKSDLRRSLAIVLQDTHLFTGTVSDNIRYGKLDASDNEVIAAAKLANAHTFIKHMPQGYNTIISGDGANLSQGQRQLLSIARAAIADPPVLILDEATSSIDTRTETLIQQGMDKLMKGRTVFVIAHRLSTIRNSDAIMVLEHGEIIERGDHQELLDLYGQYYQLYTGMNELS